MAAGVKVRCKHEQRHEGWRGVEHQRLAQVGCPVQRVDAVRVCHQRERGRGPDFRVLKQALRIRARICTVHARIRWINEPGMLAAVICCVSVLCTTSLASFGMDMASSARMGQHGISSMGIASIGAGKSGAAFVGSSADEDVVRLGSGCLLFHEFFAALAVLVSILYYAIVKASLMAMGAVIMTPPKPHPIYSKDELESCPSSPSQSGDDLFSPDVLSPSSASSSQPPSDDEYGEEEMDVLQHARRQGDEDACDSADVGSSRIVGSVPGAADAGRSRIVGSVSGAADAGSSRIAGCVSGAADAGSSRLVGSVSGAADADGAPADSCAVDLEAGGINQRGAPTRPSTDPSRSGSRRDKRRGGSLSGRGGESAAFGARRKLKEAASQPHARIRPSSHAAGERFSAIKIWTNIYGLSIGIYCLVYSLMLPNELSAFVFCAATLAASIHEWVVPCMGIYMRDDDGVYCGLLSSSSHARVRRLARSSSSSSSSRGACTQCKRCLGFACIAQWPCMAWRVSRHRNGRWRSSSSSLPSRLLESGALAMPCLILMIAAGLVLKVLEAVFWQDAIVKNMAIAESMSSSSSSSYSDGGEDTGARLWPSYSPTLLGSIFGGGRGPGVDALDAIVNIMFPIIGVLALKSMKKAVNIRETIELAVPVCGLNSLCVMCIILMQHSICLSRHLSSTISMADTTKSIGAVNDDGLGRNNYTASMSSSQILQQPADVQAIVRFQPILAALGLPFPLMCSIVCIVAAGRNHRVMVGDIYCLLASSFYAAVRLILTRYALYSFPSFMLTSLFLPLYPSRRMSQPPYSWPMPPSSLRETGGTSGARARCQT